MMARRVWEASAPSVHSGQVKRKGSELANLSHREVLRNSEHGRLTQVANQQFTPHKLGCLDV